MEQTARYLSGAERPASARHGRLVPRSADRARAGARRRGSASKSSTPTAIARCRLNEAATTQSLRLTRAGFYQVRLANGRDDLVGVNPDRRESDLDVDPGRCAGAVAGRSEAPAQRGCRATDASRREHEPFSVWWYIMLLVLLAALAESWLASRYLGTRREES